MFIQTWYSTPKHCTYTPQQNGVVERKSRTLVEMARCMLYSKGLHKKNWVEAVSCANFILNRVPTKVVKHVTPEKNGMVRNLILITLRCLVVNVGLIFLMINGKS